MDLRSPHREMENTDEGVNNVPLSSLWASFFDIIVTFL